MLTYRALKDIFLIRSWRRNWAAGALPVCNVWRISSTSTAAGAGGVTDKSNMQVTTYVMFRIDQRRSRQASRSIELMLDNGLSTT